MHNKKSELLVYPSSWIYIILFYGFLAVTYQGTLATPRGSKWERLVLVFSTVLEEAEPGCAIGGIPVCLGNRELFLSMLCFFSFQTFWVGQRSEWLTSRKTRAPRGQLQSVSCCMKSPQERLWSALTCSCLMNHSSPGMIIEDFLLKAPHTVC